LSGYLMFAEALARKLPLPDALNFGPRAAETVTVSEVAEAVMQAMGVEAGWAQAPGEHPPEMKHLSLDASQAEKVLGWRPRLAAADALQWTADWYRAYDQGLNSREFTMEQIGRYEALGPAD
jgi:CDP-glucose 4,6-dehydratase